MDPHTTTGSLLKQKDPKRAIANPDLKVKLILLIIIIIINNNNNNNNNNNSNNNNSKMWLTNNFVNKP